MTKFFNWGKGFTDIIDEYHSADKMIFYYSSLEIA